MAERSYDVLDELLTDEAKQRLEATAVGVRASLRIAEMLHQIMEEEGLNQKEIAARLGMTPGYVSRLLAGDENPSVRSMARMLHSLGRTYIQESGRKKGPFDVIGTSTPMVEGVDGIQQRSANRELISWKDSVDSQKNAKATKANGC